MIKNTAVEEFLAGLAGKSSTPGGGSAAAMIGAMAAALVSMVANLTIGKKGYEAITKDMEDLLVRSEQAREELEILIQSDVEVFDRVMAAYAMPRETERQKTERIETIQSALKQATEVPLACATLSRKVIELSKEAAEKGNRNVISDAGVAVEAANAALRSAALNVLINLAGIRDEGFVADRRGKLDSLLAGSGELTEEIYALVKSRL